MEPMSASTENREVVSVREPGNVVQMTVAARDGHGDCTVAVGDALFSGDAILSKNATGRKFAVALATVPEGQTADIPVRITYTRGLEPGDYCVKYPGGIRTLVSADGTRRYRWLEPQPK